MRDKPLWLMLVLAVFVGLCLGTSLFWGWFNFRPNNEVTTIIEPTVAVADVDGGEQSVDLVTAVPESIEVVTVQATGVPLPAPTDVPEEPTALPQPTETAVPPSPPTSVPTIIPPTEVPQSDSSTTASVAPTVQTVSFAEAEFAEFISQQAGSLGLELTDTEAEFASGQGTITGSLNTFGLRMGTELNFTLVAEAGEPQLTVTNGTIGSQPMPRQIIEQIETAFEQGVKSGLQTNGEVYIESIQMDDGLIMVTYSQ